VLSHLNPGCRSKAIFPAAKRGSSVKTGSNRRLPCMHVPQPLFSFQNKMFSFHIK